MRDERCRFATWTEFYRMKVNTASIHRGLIALLLSCLTAWGSSSPTDESTVGTDLGLIGVFSISCKWHTACGLLSIHRPKAKLQW